MPLNPGTKLDVYEIVSLIGQGGMGEVYRARDTKLGRDVAIKTLPAEVAEDADRLARFRREAQVLASLNHPHIAAIHGLEDVDGIPFLVLELVEGEDLSERLSRGPIPLDEAIEIARQVAEALEEAHAKNIVHRDLKPANIRVTADGDIKVLDFGLAKAYTGEMGDGSVSDLSQSPTMAKSGTRAGMILGTAGYMSPEQARGKAIDKRTDIWAFGVVLYEMLTGRKLYSEETLSDTLAAVLKTEPDWMTLPTDVPAPVRRLLKRCLTKNPKTRLHDIADARLELDDALDEPSEIALHSAAPSRLPWVLVALLSLTSVALAWVHLSRPNAANDLLRADIAPPLGTTFSLDPTNPGIPNISPDGSLVAFTATEPDGTHQLYIRSLIASTSRAVDTAGQAGYPFWSPDGKFVAFFSSGKLRRVASAGGPPEVIADAFLGKGGSWNGDDVILFAPSPTSPIERVSANGGESTPVTELDLNSEHNSHRHPRFLPDGQHFLYFARSQTGPEHNSVLLGSLDGAAPRFLLNSETAAIYASGHLLFVHGGALLAQRFDVDGLTLLGEPVRLIEGMGAIRATGIANVSASDTGLLLYQLNEGETYSKQLELLDATGATKLRLGETGIQTQVTEMASVISPDGRYAAVGIIEPGTGMNNVWLVDLGREILTRFTFEPGNELFARWSPDGSKLAFLSEQEGVVTLQVRDVAGSDDAKLVLELPENWTGVQPLGWSPDGKLLAVSVTSESNGGDVWIVPLDVSHEPYAFLETRFNEYAAFSPDGDFMVVQSDESGQNEVYIAPFPGPGRKLQVSIDGGTSPRFRADGRAIFYQHADNQVVTVALERRGDVFEIGAVTPLFDVSGFSNTESSWWPSPDGQEFLVARPAQQEHPPLSLVVNWTEMLRAP